MRNYSFLNTIVLVNGFEITEWDTGDDVITIDRRAENIDVVSADGVMTVALTADKSGILGFRLQQTSPSNLTFSNLVNAQDNGVFVPIFAQFKDTQGLDLASGTQGYITKPPTMTRGTGPNGQLWNIVVERLDMLLGGNP